VVLGVGFAFAVVFFSNVPSETGPIASASGSEAELTSRGQYLVTAGNCASCHTVRGGGFMAGGVAFETPFGTLYSTNISSDPETGIGAWSDRDFLNSMRYGVRPNGEHLYPAFPYTAFTKTADEDIAAMYAYLQSIPPVQQSTPENELSFPFNERALLPFWKFLYLDAGEFEPDSNESEQHNRGAYLVEALGHCSACHSPRNFLGAEKTSVAMSGGEYLDRVERGNYRPWSAPNLTGTERGLALWSHQDVAEYLKTARNGFIESFGPMNEVIMNSTRHLSEADIRSMAEYLKGLTGVDEAISIEPDSQIMGRGRTIYNLHCGTCHLPTGEGDPEMAPKLNQGSLVVQSDNPASMINAILYSPKTPGAPLLPKWRHPMEEFQYELDDEEIAAVATFIRNSWENAAGTVTAQHVARQR
jgi:mono/diheme cytochrome c family protein